MIVGTVEATMLVLLTIIVLGPILTERVRIPGIIGLIFGGMLVGPFVLDWLPAGGLVDDLGAIGILYLMFLAGLSFDLRAFQANRHSAITYGLLGFVVPFALTIGVVLALSDIGLLGAALVGAMWASNTLVAYPEVQAAGLQKNRAVSAAVSAGVVADLLSLTVLALVTTTAVIESEPFRDRVGGQLTDIAGRELQPSTPDPALPLWVALPVLLLFCLWVLPRITRVFFVEIGRSRMQRFVFALVGMSAGATIALLGGIEGLIGAFLAGLGINRLVPSEGRLMERIEFVGTAIFVPAFLVSIGLNIDPAVLVDAETLLLGLLFTGFVVVGKTAAAVMTGLAFKFTFDEVALMSSLSFGQAASTLAIAQVGLSLGMFDQIVVNAAVIAIVLTALITSLGARFFARRVPQPETDGDPLGTAVIVDIRKNGSELDGVVTVAAAVADHDDGLVVPFVVAAPGQLDEARAEVDAAVDAVSARGLDAEGLVRIDDSFADGTVNLVEEQDVSLVVLSWSGPRLATDFLFGNDIDGIGEASTVPTMAVRLLRPWQRVVVPILSASSDWQRDDNRLALETARRIASFQELPLILLAREAADTDGFGDGEHVDVVFVDEPEREAVTTLRADDLLVVPAHAMPALSPRGGRRAVAPLADTNVVVVGGPHRLSISRGVTRRSYPGAMRPQ